MHAMTKTGLGNAKYLIQNSNAFAFALVIIMQNPISLLWDILYIIKFYLDIKGSFCRELKYLQYLLPLSLARECSSVFTRFSSRNSRKMGWKIEYENALQYFTTYNPFLIYFLIILIIFQFFFQIRVLLLHFKIPKKMLNFARFV